MARVLTHVAADAGVAGVARAAEGVDEIRTRSVHARVSGALVDL